LLGIPLFMFSVSVFMGGVTKFPYYRLPLLCNGFYGNIKLANKPFAVVILRGGIILKQRERTAAIYCRLSRDDGNDAESNSIVTQRAMLERYAKEQGFSVYDCYIDDGWSGTNFDRPGMKQMLELVRKGDIDCVIVKDFSRFGRNYIEAGDYIEYLFPFMGVRFISVNDGYDSSKEDISAGNLNVAFMNLIHDLYAKDISEKTKTSQRLKWEKGENIAGHPIYGYSKAETNRHKLIIDKTAAAVVRQIFDMAVKGVEIKDIAKTLNDSNIPTPNKYGRIFSNCTRDWKRTNSTEFWTRSNIRRILTDERYTGKSICGKWRRIEIGNQKYTAVPESEWIVKDNAFEAIVSHDTFIKAQKNRRSISIQTVKSVSKVKKQRIIYAKIRCGSCGLALKRQPYKNPVFVCETPKYTHSPDCIKERILESKIELALFETIQRQIEVFADYERLQRDKSVLFGRKRDEISAQICDLTKSMQKHTQNRISLYDNYKDNIINRENYITERGMLTSQIDGIEKQIQILEFEFEQILLSNTKSVEIDCTKFANFKELTREMVDNLVESVIVYNGDRMEINLKYSDEFTEITTCK